MVNNINLSLPSWYKAEKETAHTLYKLTGSQELSFYLKNPDPFIRRLAILRAGQLKCKDSYTLLSGILDDKLESEENRELAALFMQKLNHDLQLGFFISNSYLSKYTGEENIEELLDIAVTDTFPDIRFHFENALIESRLHFDNEFLKSNLDEKAYDFPFSLKDWLSHCSAGILTDLKKGVKRVARSLFIEYPKKGVLWAASLPKQVAHKKLGQETRTEGAQKNTLVQAKTRRTRFHKAYTYRPPLSSRLKGLLRKIAKFVFFPFRFIFHFKWVILITLIILYGIFSFTRPGQLYLFRINPKVYYMNTGFLERTKKSVIEIINSNETLAAILNHAAPSASPPTVQEEPAVKFAVTAPKGLYLRSEPSAHSQKLVLMKLDTVAEFMGEEKIDSSGVKWLKLKIDETIGWANAQWLREGKK